MADSVYEVIEIIGTSDTSWEEAAKTAAEEAAGHLEDLRVAEIVKLGMHIVDNKITAHRARVSVSFKYQASIGGDERRESPPPGEGCGTAR